MTSIDRRVFPRLRMGAGSYASYPEGAGAVRDLSVRGVFVEDPAPPLERTRLELKLHLNGEILQLRGIVHRSAPRRGMVVQFVHDTNSRARLEKYLDTLFRAEGGGGDDES